MIKKICIVGYGFVGMAQMALLKTIADGEPELEISVIDPDKGFSLEDNREALRAADLAIICVPTPEGDDGSVDTSIVESAVDMVAHHNETALILIRSTVTPGTTSRIGSLTGTRRRLHFMPEFIVERTGQDDDSRIIIGGPQCDQIVDVYAPRMTVRYNKTEASSDRPLTVYTNTSPLLAELIKYRTNAFLAMKVAFAVEMAQLSELLGLDNDHVVDIWELDSRVGTTHNRVIRNEKGEAGFGGKCLPKDTAAIVAFMDQHDVGSPLLDTVLLYKQGS